VVAGAVAAGSPVASIPDRAGEADGQDRHAVAESVRQALGALPARQRAALVLRFFEDLPEAQVADLLGCSVGTVKTHTHRGVRRLRELLGAELVPEDPGPELDQVVNELPGRWRDRG